AVAGAGLASTGALMVSAGATVSLHSMTLNAGATLGGGGTLTLDGTTAVNAAITFGAATTQTGTVIGSGTVVVGAPFTWTAGVTSATGGVQVPAGQALTLSSGNQKVLDNAPWLNQGLVVASGGPLYLQSNAAVTNAAGAVWDVQSDFGMTSSGCGGPTFSNAGLLQMTGGAHTLSVTSCVAFSNTGSVQLRIGGTSAGQYDVLAGGSGATLGGTLDLPLVNGFVPASGNTFNVVTYNSRIGTFAVIDGHGQTYTPTYGANILTLQVP
ncbi:MAG: hypothetical protein AB7O93_11985, partial [Vicinamibacterales bacterium]